MTTVGGNTACGAEADYFERNRERTRYPSFRSHNLFVGSGARGNLSNRDRQTSQIIGYILGRPWS